MDLQKLTEEIAELELKLEELIDIVADRWRKFNAGNHMYFNSWRLDGENACVNFTYPRDNYIEQEVIPAIYFSEDNEDKAVQMWKEERERRCIEAEKTVTEKKERAEMEMLEKLKQKYPTTK